MTSSKHRNLLERIFKLLLSGSLLLCRRKNVCHNDTYEENTQTHSTKKKASRDSEANRMTILEKVLPQVNQDKVKAELRRLDELQKVKLEENFQDVSLDAEEEEKRRDIQCIVNRLEEFKQKRRFYQFFQAIQHLIEEVSSYQSRFDSHPLKSEEFESIKEGVETHAKSIKTIQRSTEGLLDIDNLNQDSSKSDLYRWAKHLERLAEEMEDNMPFFPYEACQSIESVCVDIILEARNKPHSESRREPMRRLRFAAGFILNLIETEREESERERQEAVKHFQRLSQASEAWKDED